MWSKTRKRLEEDLLCEALRGRVQYFLTHYHGAPDQYGRFCMRVDGVEYMLANPYNENRIYAESNRLQKELQVPRRQWAQGQMLFEAENRAVEALAEAHAMEENRMDVWQVMDAIDTYLQQDITQSLQSDNQVVRVLAVLDRRAGKRTLCKLWQQRHSQPQWVQFFYALRLSAENWI